MRQSSKVGNSSHQMNLKTDVYNVSNLEENQNAVLCSTSSKVFCSKETYYLCMPMYFPNLLAHGTHFAQLVRLLGINFTVCNSRMEYWLSLHPWLDKGVKEMRWSLHI